MDQIRGENSEVYSFIDLEVNDYKAGRYITLTDKILNNVYVSADSLNDTWGPRIIITVRVE